MTQRLISELRPNPISEKLYGKITKDPHFITLKQSISTDAIREPLQITESGYIISGVRRYYAALELGIDKLPVVISSVEENEVNEMMVMVHQQHRNKTPVQIFREIEAINERYLLKQKGRPQSTDIEKKAARKQKKELLSLVSKTTNYRLEDAKNNLIEIYGDKNVALDEMMRMEKEEGLTPSAIKRKAVELLAEKNKSKNSGEKKNQHPDKFRIIKHDSRLEFPTKIKDKSVSCVLTSPAYPFSVRDYKTGKDQIGHEKTLSEYIKSLVKLFRNCKRVLKDTGSLFINISDSIQNGSLQNVPAKLAEALKEDGWIFNSNIIWLKENPIFQDKKRPVPSYESILHFTLNQEFNYYTDWINGDIINDRMFYGDLGKQVRLRDFWDDRRHIIKCPVANNQKLSDYLLKEGYHLTHSATFPVEVALSIINSVCKPNNNEIILDCCSGLSTTGIAALNINGAYYIGLDNNPDYIKQAEVRLSKFIEDKAKREEVEEPKKKHSFDWLVSNDLDDEYFDDDIERDLDNGNDIQYELETYKKAA